MKQSAHNTKVAFIAYGTRGDVQPVVALAKGLQAAGHGVRMLAGANFRAWIESHGFEAVPTRVDMRAMMGSERGQAWVEQGHNPLKQVRRMKELFAAHGADMMRDAWSACRDATAVVSGFTSDVYAASIAEKLGVPHVNVLLQPLLVATRSGAASTQAPFPARKSIVNYWFTRWILEPFNWQMMGAINNDFREKELGLPAQTRAESRAAQSRALVVHGFSRHVVPPAADWPPNVRTAGFWFLDEEQEWQPPDDLATFLEAGSPPVYVGFGSMTGRDPRALTDLVVCALRDAGQRGILQAGWVGMGDRHAAGSTLPEDVFALDAAPHHLLFPRMAAVIHHGGAGTTAVGLRAGVPTVIVPHMADQPFWGTRVAALGAGPSPIPRQNLTAGRLAAAVRQAVGDPEMRRRAAELSALIRAEDGVGSAVEMIGRHLAAGGVS